MGKPTVNDIADALGIQSNQVNALHKRGMPIHKLKKAREWFDKNGFDNVHHGKVGAAANNGPKMSSQINAALGSGRGVMPSNVELTGYGQVYCPESSDRRERG